MRLAVLYILTAFETKPVLCRRQADNVQPTMLPSGWV